MNNATRGKKENSKKGPNNIQNEMEEDMNAKNKKERRREEEGVKREI